MSTFTLAAAQSCSVPLDIAANVQHHLQLIHAAAQHGVQWLVFPELSLTGYELPHLAALAKPPHEWLDEDLLPLQQAAQQLGMSITVGLPVQLAGLNKPCIAALTLHPHAAPSLYCKQYLHGSEREFAASPTLDGTAPAAHVQRLLASSQSSNPATVSLPIASAICFDSNQAAHAQAAAHAGAQVYAAGVLVSPQSYAADAALWQQAAQANRLCVLIANHGAPSGPYASAGRSACWAPDGTLLGEVAGLGTALLVVQITPPLENKSASIAHGYCYTSYQIDSKFNQPTFYKDTP
ncbi:carbon-nitrogen hydrolase family protein [Curvibacter sp. CHRR-16]|uniref:carbon-nitrogen hydrolase family protein n=1 Tax=Curvibacter sp. CHRR-16 TaxID=2835872 RepID=UPI001BDAA914|nr:carbon-nitrogen hydrolase family protein [Curvibacter sp. CHRR-16]MBT0569322.1 carbon-nitrogen hydrolase family protein [Curvibacter sp. CHRR-16]